MLSALSFSINFYFIQFERRGRAMGVVMTSFSVASVFGVPFGLFLANLYSWHAPFVFLGAIGLVIQASIFKIIPPVNAHLLGGINESPFALLHHVKKHPHQWLALSLIPTLMIGHFTIVPFLSPYLVSNVGFTNNQLTFVYMFGGLATIFTSPLIGKLVDRRGSAIVFSVSALIALIPVWLITHMGPTPVPYVVAVTTAFFIIGGGRMVPAMAIVTSAVEPKHRGGFMSLNSALQQLFSGIASLIAGAIVTRAADDKLVNYDKIAYLTIVASVICIWIANRAVRGQNKKASASSEGFVSHEI
jgi:predicted MFS family arabinose efflux permease